MSALKDLLNRYNEGDKMSNLEMLVVISRDERAAEELAELKAKIAELPTHLWLVAARIAIDN